VKINRWPLSGAVATARFKIGMALAAIGAGRFGSVDRNSARAPRARGAAVSRGLIGTGGASVTIAAAA